VQPPELPPPPDGATQLPLGSQTFGVAQSVTEAHVFKQRPPAHTNGSHGVLLPDESCTVWSSEQVVPDWGMHAPPEQRKPGAQSPSTLHVFLHFVAPSQPKLPGHGLGAPLTHWPCPSQVLSVSTPAAHAVSHVVVAGAKTHWLRLGGVHALPHVVPAPAHAERVPCGAPVTGVHVPTEPPTSHASHCAVQAVSQHTPSTQKVESQSTGALHGLPFAAKPTNSAVFNAASVSPPVTSTSPEGSSVAVCCARAVVIVAVAAKLPPTGSKISAIDTGEPLFPPATSTLPDASSVAVCQLRGIVIAPVPAKVPEPGSNNSVLAVRKFPSAPPAIRTLPETSSVAVGPLRAVAIDPVAAKVPAFDESNSSAVDVSRFP
jgi:hypothetical protein